MKGSPLRGGGRSTPKKKQQLQQQQQQDDNDEEDSNNYIHPNLGPPWEIKEVTDFFNIAKKSEPDWRLVSKKFPNRTEEMLKQLYKISKPISNYSTPEFLLFFIQGVYRISQIEQPQHQQPPPPPPPQQKLPPHHSQLQQLLLIKQQKDAQRDQQQQQQQQSPTKTSSKGRTIYDNNIFNSNSNSSINNNNNNNLNNNNNNNNSSNSFNNSNTLSIENLGQNNNGRPKGRRLFPPSENSTSTSTTATSTAISNSIYDSPSKRKTNNKELSLCGDSCPSLPTKLRGKAKQGKADGFQMSPNGRINHSNQDNNHNSQIDEDDDNDDHKHLLEFQRSYPNTPQRQQQQQQSSHIQFTPHQQQLQQSLFQNILQSPTLDQIQTIDDNHVLIPSKENQNLIQKRLVNFLSNQKQPTPKSIKSISPKISGINQDSSMTLSKPGRWATYEWFYSDLDTPFYFYNEFQLFIHQLHLPKKLSRMEWNSIRSRMRKPRRLSQQFYLEARNKLDKTRDTVRQSMISNDGLKFLQIEPNSKVLYIYENSLENGKVISYNRISKTYSILSDKSNKVIEIPDEEVMSADKDVRYCIEQSHIQSKEKNQSNDNSSSNDINKNNNSNNNNIVNSNNNKNYINNSYSNKNTPYKRKFEDTNKISSPNQFHINNNNQNINNSSISNNNSNSTILTDSDQVVTLVVGLSEVLERKQNLLSKIHDMNEEAKSMVISGFPVDFQKKYSELLISIEYHNSVLQTLLEIFRKNNYTRRISKFDEYQTNDKKTLLPELIELYKNKSDEFINNVDRDLIHQQQHHQQLQLQQSHQQRELKDDNLKRLLNSIISFIFLIKNQSVNIELSKEDIDFIFDYCLNQIRPKSSENLEVFKEIEKSIDYIKNKIKNCKSE